MQFTKLGKAIETIFIEITISSKWNEKKKQENVTTS